MPEQQKSNRGGSGRGQGRKPLPEDERTVVVTVRLTPARRDKLRRLGAHGCQAMLKLLQAPLALGFLFVMRMA